jgi:hypothetical protein
MSKINDSIMRAYNGIMTEGTEGTVVAEVLVEAQLLKEEYNVTWHTQDAKLTWNDKEIQFDAVSELDLNLDKGEQGTEIEINEMSITELSFNDGEDSVDLSKLNPAILEAVQEAIKADAVADGEALVSAAKEAYTDGAE